MQNDVKTDVNVDVTDSLFFSFSLAIGLAIFGTVSHQMHSVITTMQAELDSSKASVDVLLGMMLETTIILTVFLLIPLICFKLFVIDSDVMKSPSTNRYTILKDKASILLVPIVTVLSLSAVLIMVRLYYYIPISIFCCLLLAPVLISEYLVRKRHDQIWSR